MLLYIVCFIGACAGSTTSGIKIVHFVIIWKYMVTSVKKMFFQPRTILPIHLNHRVIDSSAINLSICYFIANIFLLFVGAAVMVLVDSMDYQTAMSSVISALMNIGPGFGEIGPSEKLFANICSWKMVSRMADACGQTGNVFRSCAALSFFLEKIKAVC